MMDVVVKTKRLNIFVASKEQMEQFIAEQSVDAIKAAYLEMLSGCLMHPAQWEWYAIWMIELKSGAHIGELCFKGILDDGSIEIGYGIAKEYRNYGYATEAVSALVDWALKQTEVVCVKAEVEEANVASLCVLKKAGFTKTGEIGDEGPIFIRRKNGCAGGLKRLVIYIHGKGGTASEAEHFVPIFCDCKVIGFEYKSETPWEAALEFSRYYDEVSKGYDSIYLIANSIGAFFALYSLGDKKIEKAFFISPVVDMEELIFRMMKRANVTEEELKAKGEVEVDFGEKLSWEYLTYIRNNPVKWSTKTHILYGEKDELVSYASVAKFAAKVGSTLDVAGCGEHWFHTDEQMQFLDTWLMGKMR